MITYTPLTCLYVHIHIILTQDDPSFTDGAPTRHNIIESMRWLVYGAQPGDSLLLHYSGHGGSVRDRNGDEVDSKCAMCACVCNE